MAEMEEDRVLPIVVHDPKLVIVRGETRMTERAPAVEPEQEPQGAPIRES
jgi:hypothetical protein